MFPRIHPRDGVLKRLERWTRPHGVQSNHGFFPLIDQRIFPTQIIRDLESEWINARMNEWTEE